MVLEENYRYTGVNGTCEYNAKGHTTVAVATYHDVPANDSNAMKQAVAQ